MFRKKGRTFLDGQERRLDCECYVELDSKGEEVAAAMEVEIGTRN